VARGGKGIGVVSLCEDSKFNTDVTESKVDKEDYSLKGNGSVVVRMTESLKWIVRENGTWWMT
jgi:hypothetical protein